MKDLILDSFYAYDPAEYMPVFYDGQLANKAEFYSYKAKRVIRKLGQAVAAARN